MRQIEDELTVIDAIENIVEPRILTKKGELRYRIKTALHMYAPEELVKLAKKHKLTPKTKKVPQGEAVPGVLVADLLVLRLIIDGIEGDKTAIKLLFEHGFGRPDLNVNYTGMDELDEGEAIPLSTEEKIAHLRAIRSTTLEAQYADDDN